MEKSLSEYINESDMLVIGIGSEWDWIKKGIKKDLRYQELRKYCDEEENAWLWPIVEFEYGYYNNDERIDEAYKGLRKLVGQKSYFLVSDLFIQDAFLNGFEKEHCVYPCGNYRYLQSNDPEEELIEVTKSEDFQGIVSRIHKIITERNGILGEEETFYKPFFDGKLLYLNQKREEYSKIKYNERAYLYYWDKYQQYLSSTLGKNLLILELGVSLDYPTVIRWPFEKVTFINKKAHLIRVHEKLFHHTPEIKVKTDSIQMNSVNYILQESEGL